MLEAELAGESKGDADTELATVEGEDSAVMFLFSWGCWGRAVVVAMVERMGGEAGRGQLAARSYKVMGEGRGLANEGRSGVHTEATQVVEWPK